MTNIPYFLDPRYWELVNLASRPSLRHKLICKRLGIKWTE